MPTNIFTVNKIFMVSFQGFTMLFLKSPCTDRIFTES